MRIFVPGASQVRGIDPRGTAGVESGNGHVDLELTAAGKRGLEGTGRDGITGSGKYDTAGKETAIVAGCCGEPPVARTAACIGTEYQYGIDHQFRIPVIIPGCEAHLVPLQFKFTRHVTLHTPDDLICIGRQFFHIPGGCTDDQVAILQIHLIPSLVFQLHPAQICSGPDHDIIFHPSIIGVILHVNAGIHFPHPDGGEGPDAGLPSGGIVAKVIVVHAFALVQGFHLRVFGTPHEADTDRMRTQGVGESPIGIILCCCRFIPGGGTPPVQLLLKLRVIPGVVLHHGVPLPVYIQGAGPGIGLEPESAFPLAFVLDKIQ